MAEDAEAARLKEERRAKRRNRWGNAEEVRPYKLAVELCSLRPRFRCRAALLMTLSHVTDSLRPLALAG